MADALDSIVKGAPVALPGQNLSKAVGGTSPVASSTAKASDPLNHTPSSPSMIYLNLLVLEASLRAQYLELRARRRHHTFFLSLLTIWTAGFGYALFLAPREDGSGVGGSVYWMVETTERMCFLGGLMTGTLVWATGIWERGVRWPRRWFAVSNRGLRGFNCKLVIMKRPWWKEALATTGWFLTYGLFSSSGSSYRYVEPALLREVDKELNLAAQGHPNIPIIGGDEEKGGHDEDISPGGDYVKLLLLAKPFSPTFRENWELYRSEYWERENERRALLRQKLKQRDQRLRKEQGGWFWWLPWRRPVVEKPHAGRTESEKIHHHPRHAAVVGEHKRTRSNSTRRGSMSAGTTSRSSTPSPGAEGEDIGLSRKASTASNASDKRRKKLVAPGAKSRPRVESRSGLAVAGSGDAATGHQSEMRLKAGLSRTRRNKDPCRCRNEPPASCVSGQRLIYGCRQHCLGFEGLVDALLPYRSLSAGHHRRLNFTLITRHLRAETGVTLHVMEPIKPPSLTNDALRTAPYQTQRPSPPFIPIPPVFTDRDDKFSLAPKFSEVDPEALTEHDLNIITQGREQTAKDHTSRWQYESRRQAQAITDFLYLGPSTVARNLDYLKKEEFTMILMCRHPSFPIGFLSVDKAAASLGIVAEKIDVEDGPAFVRVFPQAVRVINNHLLDVYRAQAVQGVDGPAGEQVSSGDQMVVDLDSFKRGRVLVCCETGNDRSAAIVAAYLMAVFGVDMVKAIQFVSLQRFCVDFNDSTKYFLQSYETLLQAKRDVAGHMRDIGSNSIIQQLEEHERGPKRRIDDVSSSSSGDDSDYRLMDESDEDRNGQRAFTPFVDPDD
ncbi:Spo7-like protein-domain-containing protein [Echria macrotheca]|uniref:Spo7-like protein-domain-containing protein n=1 Tax=Echria macrotheca TaxID=438768 RepID=A0AAJ0B5U8_9PEZI|nr:Spo7-like protein-domain-containing protein [Echria macrotheca]